MASGNGKPTLYCSCNNNSEPSMIQELFFFFVIPVINIYYYYCCCRFDERGRLFAKQEVKAIQSGPNGLGLYFTGDHTGLITVWKWLAESKA
jgi:hypothetical protein